MHLFPPLEPLVVAAAVWESQADTYYKDKPQGGDDAEGETGTS